MGWFRRRDKQAEQAKDEELAALRTRVGELEARLAARERELEAAYADVDAASAELEASAVAVRDALAVVDAIERDRDEEGDADEPAAK
jgi:hypothetical protein